MAQQVINNGESGLVVRQKLNANFAELYRGLPALTAPNDGLSATSSAVNAFIEAGGGVIGPGTYLVDSSYVMETRADVICHPDARFIPAVNGMDMVQVPGTDNAFGYSWRGGRFENNGKTGVTAFNMRQAHLYGRIEEVSIVGDSLAVPFACGINLRELCWESRMLGNYIANVDIGFDLNNGSNGVLLYGNTVEYFNTRGFILRTGTAPLPLVCVQMERNTAQFGPIGFEDRSRGAVHSNNYTEGCTTADVFLNGAIGSVVEYGYHSADTGVVCVRGRDAIGCRVSYPRQQVTRSTGIFDFDNTNAHCTYELNRQASLGAPLGITTGIKGKENLSGNPEVSDIGTDAAFQSRAGTLLGGTVIPRPIVNGLGPVATGSLSINAAQATPDFFVTVTGGNNVDVSALADDQEVKLYLKLAGSYTTGTVSVGGVALNMTGAAANRRKVVIIRRIAQDAGATWLYETEQAWR